MHPDVAVVLLQTDVVALSAVAVDGGEVADFDGRGVFDAYAPAVEGGVVAYASMVMPGQAVLPPKSITMSPLSVTAGSVICPMTRIRSGRDS